jgi:predicted transcriptional regulator
MSKTAVITARLDAETLADLDALAKRLDRPRAWIVARAVEQVVQAETELDKFLQEGQAALARGDSLSQEEMEIWLEARIAARATAQAAE